MRGSGIALNSTQLNLSRILGPAIGGILMLRAGALSCFALRKLYGSFTRSRAVYTASQMSSHSSSAFAVTSSATIESFFSEAPLPSVLYFRNS